MIESQLLRINLSMSFSAQPWDEINRIMKTNFAQIAPALKKVRKILHQKY